jgi:hypothetical protein
VGGFERSETGTDEKLDFALIAEAGDDTAVAGRIEAGEQGAGGSHEHVFEQRLLDVERLSASSGTPSAAGFGIGPAGRIAGEATPGIGGKEIEPRLR